MKNLKPCAFSIAALAIFAFLILSCGKAETAGDKNSPAASVFSNNSARNASFAPPLPSVEPSPDDSKNLLFIRKWVGKYPVNRQNKEYGDLFNQPPVKNVLVGIVGKNNFQNLLNHFAAPVLIEEKSGFVVIFGTTGRKRDEKVGYGLIAVQPETGETHIYFTDDGKLKSFSNRKGEGTLPLEIKQTILIYAGDASLIGTIKRKPDEGYLCYAVLYKDWDAPQKTRPYIFYITDSGGRMNIANADVELKRKSETERKGENGKTYAEWIYENKTARSRFDLVVSEIPDSSAVVYDGTVSVTTGDKTQSAQIKAFCGG